MNDGQGAPAGDDVLKPVADAIAGAKRGFDSAARVGGEEFAVLAPDCDEHGAFMLAERIRAAVHAALVSRGEDTSLTISFGISTFPLHGQSADALLRTADQALYAAKRLGRNRSVISSAEVPGILARAPHPPDDAHGGARCAGRPRRGARRARLGERPALPQGRPVRRADRPRARAGPRGVERMRLAGVLHDVGRVALPETLLAKEDALTDDEWVLVAHPAVGAA